MYVIYLFNIIDVILLLIFLLLSFLNLIDWVTRCLDEKSIISISRPRLSFTYMLSLFLIVPEVRFIDILIKDNNDISLHVGITILIYLSVGCLYGVKYIMLMSKYKNYILISNYNDQETRLFFKSLFKWPFILNKTVGQILKTL